MNPAKVDRSNVVQFTDLPNVGRATAMDLKLLGYEKPSQLGGQCAYAMYDKLCDMTGVRHDPCVIDVFLSITRFVDGEPARAWWKFTAERQDLRSSSVSTVIGESIFPGSCWGILCRRNWIVTFCRWRNFYGS
jgi:hypothetical protein